MKLVGLVGFIGNGKGTVADLLVDRHGFEKESFANSLKDAVSIIFGWDRYLLEGATEESRKWREEPDDFWSKKFNKDFSPRLALQLMGTEAGRDVFHKDIWIYSLERRLQKNKSYVIADVRFPNEIEAIQNMGGKIVRVKRGDNPWWYNTALDYNNGKTELKPEAHFSEWAWIGSPIDMILDNNCDMYQLKSRVDKMVDSLYNNGVESYEANEVLL